MTSSFSTPRLLFVHGPQPQMHHQEALERVLGKDHVVALIPHTFALDVLVYTVWLLTAAAMIGGVVAVWKYVSLGFFIASLCAALTLIGVSFAFARRVTLCLTLFHGRKEAEALIAQFRPTLLVACSYGAVIVLSLREVVAPLLLFSPAQDQFAKFAFLKPAAYDLMRVPYTLICHGVRDTEIPYANTVRLSRTVPDSSRCHVIALNSSDPTLQNVIADEEVKKLAFYTYCEGWIATFSMERALIRDMNLHTDAYALDLPDLVLFSTIALNRSYQKRETHSGFFSVSRSEGSRNSGVSHRDYGSISAYSRELLNSPSGDAQCGRVNSLVVFPAATATPSEKESTSLPNRKTTELAVQEKKFQLGARDFFHP